MNSLNFIVKESQLGFYYAGCQAEQFLYVINPDHQHNTDVNIIQIGKNPQCGIVCKDDTLLAIGALNGELLIFSLTPT